MNPFYHYSDVPNVWYELAWPAELDGRRVTPCLQSLSSNTFSASARFVTKANADEIRHYIAAPHFNAAAMKRALHTFLPDVEITDAEPFVIGTSMVARVRPSTNSLALNTDQPGATSYALLSAIQEIYEDEAIVIEWILGGIMPPAVIPKYGRQYQTHTGLGRFLELFYRQPREWNTLIHASMQEKHSTHTWKSVCLIGVEAGSEPRKLQLLSRVVGAMRTVESPGVQMRYRLTAPESLREDYLPYFWQFRVNAPELTGLLAWPLGEEQVPGVTRITSKHLAVSGKAPHGARVVAQSNVAGSSDLLTLSPREGLLHTHIIGPTGVGKSTLLLNLIAQDIANGQGVIVVDPKGDLVTDTLRRIPPRRQDDVIVLDPSDADRPVGLNPLLQGGKQPALIADDILSVFSSLYGKYFGPRTQDVMHAGLLTLCSTPGMSLCALPLLYTSPAFRNPLISKLNDPLGLGTFWSWFDGISEAERNNVLAPVMNKLRAFLMRPAMRRVIGQTQPLLDLKDVVSGNKILLVNLAKGSLGKTTSQLFGSLVVAQIWQVAQTRINVPQEHRRPVSVYIDEVQDYLHLPTDIGDVLAQARGYGIGMVLAHQHLGQLPPELKSGILSNARSRICFQLGHEDALVMSRDSKALEPSDFESLDKYHVYARLVGNGEALPWASGVTLPPSDPISELEAIRAYSRERFGRDATDVEAEIAAQISGDTTIATRRPLHRRPKSGGVS